MIVVRDNPLAWATRVTPPQPSSRASAAAHCLRIRSSISGASVQYIRRIRSIARASCIYPRSGRHRRVYQQLSSLLFCRPLQRVVNAFAAWENRYVALIGEPVPDPTRVLLEIDAAGAWVDETEFRLEHLLESGSTRIRAGTQIAASLPKGPFLAIAEQVRSFWLIGEPGSGKLTTLQRIAFDQARLLLASGRVDRPVPVLIPAAHLGAEFSLEKIVTNLLRVPATRSRSLLQRGLIWMMIDGTNEITPSSRHAVVRQVRQLALEYEAIPICFTAQVRLSAFHGSSNLRGSAAD